MKLKRKSWLVTGVMLVFMAAVTACGTGPASDTAQGNQTAADSAVRRPLTMTDGMGHKVKVPANPQRIWAPALEDPIVALGDADRLVGQYSSGNVVDGYLQKWLKGKPHIDLTGNGLDPETVLSMNPDLIILFAAGLAENGKYAQYSRIAPTYVFNVKSGSQAAWRQELLTLGTMLHQSDRAKQLLANYDKKVAAAKQKLKYTVGDKTVAIIEPSGKQLFLIGPGTFAGQEVYGDLGLKAPKLAKGWGTLSFEALPNLQADYIFVVVGNDSTSELQQLTSSPVWKNLPAVKARHVYQVSYGNWINNGVIANEVTIDDVLKHIAKD
ncbi:ABC transporter substrate-binding protein [Alicyclobacillus cycloheptanicus]|uniref:Iron complex transport system substrate-binding protein n=1 Tax=Alicyclobacillus cycloheptanicus TaxID=1457 RepID=A0ABT9XEN3_9BACL|nr:ABC transporter substrate-binding protein [Alicyclobacillus cycloheptanicus]MDQ0188754.1 iron complex transport system substrate-binding protein [Alicyclobacillus cycloheptanicus]WDM00586.1 ABC transporter substrate-binding protein [Alicyclobacillus cycloheptanicus]